MRFVQIALMFGFMIASANADDIKFIIQNETGKKIKVSTDTLKRYVVPKGKVPEEIEARGEVVLSVKPELFDANRKEKIVLSIDGCRITDIIVDFPVGSALLSAIAHDVSSDDIHSHSISFKSDQSCGQSTKWQNIIYIRSNKPLISNSTTSLSFPSAEDR